MEEHKAAHAVVAEVADEAHKMAEEAKEAADDAQQTAHVALEQSADAIVAPPTVVPDEHEADSGSRMEPDKFEEISTKLNSIGERLDGYEQRFTSLEKPPEPEPKEEPEFIEVETEPETKAESKPESKSKSKESTPENKEGQTSDKPQRKANSGRRFSRGRK